MAAKRAGRRSTGSATRYVRKSQRQLKAMIVRNRNRYRVGATSFKDVSKRIKGYRPAARGRKVHYARVSGHLKTAEQKILDQCRGGCPYNSQKKSNIPAKTRGGNLYAIDKKK